MIGLAKSAPTALPQEPKAVIKQDMVAPEQTWNAVPMDVYRYMNVDFFDASDKNLGELKDIYDYAKTRSNGMPGDIIQKLDEIKNRLGEPEIGTSRLSQLSNYVRIQRNITDLQKQRRALERGSRYF